MSIYRLLKPNIEALAQTLIYAYTTTADHYWFNGSRSAGKQEKKNPACYQT